MATPITAANSINSIAEQSDSQNALSRVINAIQNAATKTGVNFSYLMQKASQESSFDPSAKATTSSATGLFQFTSQTWLQMVKTYGSQYGLGNYAAHITADASGHLKVDSPSMKQEILALRKDPQISAEMAGELDKENAASLKQTIGGKIGSTELYLAHFLGAGGASNFIHQMRNAPNMAAADILPTAASANPAVFYDKAGQPRSLQQIYQHFAQKFDNSNTQFASAAPHIATQGVASAASTNQIAVNLAQMMPTANAATSPVSVQNAISSLRSGNASMMSLASAGGNTMFNAMLMGQVESQGLAATSPLAALGHAADNKKKIEAYSMLS